MTTVDVNADVYKRTNPDGSVEFTDAPRSEKEEPVPIKPMNTFKAPPAPPVRHAPQQPPSAQGEYTEISITSPADESTIRDNAGALEVTISLTPALLPDHKLVLLVDGVKKDESTSGTFALTDLERGAHTLTAQVQDAEGEALISAKPVTVYLHRASGFHNIPSPNPGNVNNGRIKSAPRAPMAPRAPRAPVGP